MKKHGKISLSILLVFTLAFTIGACAAEESVPPEKVDAALWERMDAADDDELIPTLSVSQNIDEATPTEKIDMALWEQMDTADDDELIPISIALRDIDAAAVAEKVRAEMGSEIDGNEAEFQAEKNRVLREEQTAFNDAFIEAHVEKRGNEVTYASRYISALFLTAKKADILYYAQLSEVTGIYYDDPSIQLAPSET